MLRISTSTPAGTTAAIEQSSSPSDEPIKTRWLTPEDSTIEFKVFNDSLGRRISTVMVVNDVSGVKYEIAYGERSPFIIVAFNMATISEEKNSLLDEETVKNDIVEGFAARGVDFNGDSILLCFYKNMVSEEKLVKEKLNYILGLDFDEVIRNFDKREYINVADIQEMLGRMTSSDRASICITARDHEELYNVSDPSAKDLLTAKYPGLFQRLWYTSYLKTNTPKSAVGFYYLICHPELLPQHAMLFDDCKMNVDDWQNCLQGSGFEVKADAKPHDLLNQFTAVIAAGEKERLKLPSGRASSLSSLLRSLSSLAEDEKKEKSEVKISSLASISTASDEGNSEDEDHAKNTAMPTLQFEASQKAEPCFSISASPSKEREYPTIVMSDPDKDLESDERNEAEKNAAKILTSMGSRSFPTRPSSSSGLFTSLEHKLPPAVNMTPTATAGKKIKIHSWDQRFAIPAFNMFKSIATEKRKEEAAKIGERVILKIRPRTKQGT